MCFCFLDGQQDISGPVVFLFCAATSSRCLTYIHSIWYLYWFGHSEHSSTSYVISGCIFISTTQGTPVYHLRFPYVDNCCSSCLSALVSIFRTTVALRYVDMKFHCWDVTNATAGPQHLISGINWRYSETELVSHWRWPLTRKQSVFETAFLHFIAIQKDLVIHIWLVARWRQLFRIQHNRCCHWLMSQFHKWQQMCIACNEFLCIDAADCKFLYCSMHIVVLHIWVQFGIVCYFPSCISVVIFFVHCFYV